MKTTNMLLTLALLLASSSTILAQRDAKETRDAWVTAKGSAAGTDDNAVDEATSDALRKAVEQACGVYIRSQSETEDYQAVFDKVLANTGGYVIEYKVRKTTKSDDTTYVTVRAHVSNRKFKECWAAQALTIHRAGNPRILLVVAEATTWTATSGPAYQIQDGGSVQTRIEKYFLKKNLQLVDHATAEKVTKRDVMLAGLKDDVETVAALGAKFHADVVIIGRASAKLGRTTELQGQKLYKYNAVLNISAVRTDSARMLLSENFPLNSNQMQENAEDLVLTALGKQSAPKVFKALIEAWRKDIDYGTVELTITGIDMRGWKIFKAAALKIKGMKELRLRELTNNVAFIDAEYKYTAENLAQRLEELKAIKLKLDEYNKNRLKMFGPLAGKDELEDGGDASSDDGGDTSADNGDTSADDNGDTSADSGRSSAEDNGDESTSDSADNVAEEDTGSHKAPSKKGSSDSEE